MGTKISALPTGTVASTDVLPVVKAGVTTGVQFGHTHPESEITNLVADLAAKAASSHTHPESDITNLVTDLAGKAASSHTHSESDITNLVTDLAKSKMLFASAASAATGADTNTTTLQTYTLPGGTLANDGDGVRIIASFSTGANNNNKDMILKFGATAIAQSTAIVANARNFFLIGVVLRRSGTTQIAAVQATQGVTGQTWISALGGQFTHTTPGETLSGNVVIAAQGQNGTASANDIVCNFMTVELLRAP